MAAATSIIWVLIAFLLTVNASLGGLDSNVLNDLNAFGQAVGSIWLWLLPVVVGWLQVSPKCDATCLEKAMVRVDDLSFVADINGAVNGASKSCLRALEIRKPRIIQRSGGGWEDAARKDEQCTAPIFNYSRFLSWALAAEDIISVFQYASHEQSQPQANSFEASSTTLVGTPGHSSHPHRVAQADKACFGPLGGNRSYPEVLSRFMVAAAIALSLQWSTVGAAVIIVWFTPTVGLGCRFGSYIVYGAASMVVWALLVTSSVLLRTGPTRLQEAAGALSVASRRLGKLLAFANAAWIVLVCVLQFTNFFDQCYCNGSYIGLRKHTYDIIVVGVGEISTMRGVWIGGVVLALGSACLFAGFVGLFGKPK